MCLRKPESVFFPLMAILILVGVVTSTIGQASDTAPRPSFFERLSEIASSFHARGRTATLDEPYEPSNGLVVVDLRDKINNKLTDGFTVDRNTLDALPTGKGDFAGVTFEVTDGVMQLTSREREKFPASIEEIAIDSQCSRLYALHATQGGSSEIPEGKRIGKYVVHYDDGSDAVWPIVYGKDVRDWWNRDRSRRASRGKVAWVGQNPAASRHGQTLRLFVSHWENPHPELRIVDIDYVSENFKSAGPFCVALTLEKEPS